MNLTKKNTQNPPTGKISKIENIASFQVKALIGHKLSDVVINSTDSLIIS